MKLEDYRAAVEAAERATLPTENDSLGWMFAVCVGEARRLRNALWRDHARPEAQKLAARWDALADKAHSELARRENETYAAFLAART